MKKDNPITTLDELDAVCREQFECEFELHPGPRKVRLALRYLTPAEDARITEIIRSVPPKMIEGSRPGERVPDLTDPAYQSALQEARLKARALTLYLCVPMFSQAKPGLSDLKEIAEFVQGKLHEAVLEMIYERIAAGPVSVEDRVNFTWPRVSRRS